MNEIPFVNQLGDALEEAFVASVGARPRRVWGLTRMRLVVVIAVLALGGVAGARTLLSSTPLAVHGLSCIAGTTLKASAGYVPGNGEPPLQVCAQALRVPASRLVACASDTGVQSVVVFYADGRDQCHRLGLQPLPASYPAAVGRVDRLVRAIVRLQAARPCWAPQAFAGQLQATLKRLGWSGWTVRELGAGQVSELPGSGSCAQIEPLDNAPDVSDSLDTGRQQLQFTVGPPPALFATLGDLATQLTKASAGSCLTLASARSVARKLLSRHGLTAGFAVTRAPRGVIFGLGRRPRYEQGCAIVTDLEPAARDPKLIDVTLNQRDAPPMPRVPVLPQSAYH